MLIFVYEYLCAGGPATSPSLHHEGWLMLDALLTDLGRCQGVHTVTLLAAHFACPQVDWLNNTAIRIEVGTEQEVFAELVRRADATLVIAPEFDDLLLTRCLWVEECGGRLLGPGVDAIRHTGDKLRLAEHLRRCGIPTPPTSAWQWTDPIASFPAVVKPRFGAGSQATFLLHKPEDAIMAAAQAAAESWHGPMIVQPYCDGLAASVAFLIGRGHCIAPPGAAQCLTADGRFRYQGGVVPLSPELNARALRLGQQAIAAVEGLFGYVGVDVMLGSSSETDDVVIEINPRLTTSYVGLRRLARVNLAEALLAVTTGRDVPVLDWNEGPVEFAAL